MALLSAVAALTLAPSANAGRLIETGHDVEYHCVDPGPIFFGNQQCGFLRTGLNYVRGGAPGPSRPILVLDRPGVNGTLGPQAIREAYGVGAAQCPDAGTGTMCRVVQPQSATFDSIPITTNQWSAIFVASDKNCGGCDLNEAPAGGAAVTPDSTEIYQRTDDIAAFFNSGGGIFVGAGAIDAGGFSGALSFDENNVPYYSFVASAGASNVDPPFSLTALGVAIGLRGADINCSGCFTHNSFGFPPAGSRLRPAETDNGGRFVTLVQDTDDPRAAISSGPGDTSDRAATFTFGAGEQSTFQCRVDNAPFGSCGSPWTAGNLSDGRHTIDVRAIDLVGNVQPTPTSATFCVPGTAEVAGNRGDEDCDGAVDPFRAIEASIRYRLRFPSGGMTISALRLRRITQRPTLRVTCRGKGCPFRSRRVRIRRRAAVLTRLFRRRGRRVRLRRGARIRISLTRRGVISKVYLFRVGRGTASFATRCQLPGSRRLRSSCPTLR